MKFCHGWPRRCAGGGWLRHDNRLGSDARTWCPNAPQIDAGAINCKRNLFVQATITVGDGIYIAEPPATRPRGRAHSARGEASRAGAAEQKNDRYIAYERTTRSRQTIHARKTTTSRVSLAASCPRRGYACGSASTTRPHAPPAPDAASDLVRLLDRACLVRHKRQAQQEAHAGPQT